MGVPAVVGSGEICVVRCDPAATYCKGVSATRLRFAVVACETLGPAPAPAPAPRNRASLQRLLKRRDECIGLQGRRRKKKKKSAWISVVA